MAETEWDELTAAIIPCPSVPLGVKLSPGRRERWREGVLRFQFYLSLSYSYL